MDLGERAAIALAERTAANLLLIDESAGRAEARRRSLRVTGTLGVLRAAAEAGRDVARAHLKRNDAASARKYLEKIAATDVRYDKKPQAVELLPRIA